jgi:feruloyl-CoA synthase
MATPLRRVRLGPAETELTHAEGGVLMLRSPHALKPYPDNLTQRLLYWAGAAPDRNFIAGRLPNGAWREVSYAMTLRAVRAIAQALLDRKLSADRPIAILSENSIEHGLLALAAMHVGIPYAPISPAYSLISTDFGKLRYTLDLLRPGLVFAFDGVKYARAITAAVPLETEIVVVQAGPDDRPCTPFAELQATLPTNELETAHAGVGPDTVAKILFTSGSTGMPKGVINTQRMLCSNQQQLLQTFPFLEDEPPTIVDWLPWNHTFGGNHNFGMTLYNGGTFYIDDGKPVSGAIEQTVQNLREIAPTLYFNVPKGFEELIVYFHREPELRKKFFSRVSLLFYAGAGLAQSVWDDLERLALETCGERILISTGLGCTESGPSAMFANWDGGWSGLMGLPVPGLELKLIPSAGEKLEALYRGPNITPGYWRRQDLTDAAFDAEGFYRTGDALRLVDPERPEKGLLFQGRVTEDFKLSTGTWVSVGILRAKVINAGAPFVQDVVIAGHDRDYVAAIIFLNLTVCANLCLELPGNVAPRQILSHAKVRAKIQDLLERMGVQGTGSASRVVRAILAEVPPSIDASEITDKGSLNQGAVLRNRAALVEELYRPSPPAHVFNIG